MKQDKKVLATIKQDMHEVLHNRTYFRADWRQEVKSFKADYKDDIKRINKEVDEDIRDWRIDNLQKAYEKKAYDKYRYLIESYHNNQWFFLIYEDGTTESISAEEILEGSNLPRLSGILYAQEQTADDWFDTLNGDLEGKFEDEDGFYDCDLYQEYENSVEVACETDWSMGFLSRHPEWVPMDLNLR